MNEMPLNSEETVLLNHDNPWPGLMSFTEEMKDYFFGREQEADELFRLIKRATMTVLFGQSGLGKSSLLQAGLFPPLRTESFLPVYIRLDHRESSPSLVDQVKTALSLAFEAEAIEAPTPLETASLWEYFHHSDTDFWNRRNRLVIPVLVFDQFEEFFSQGCCSEVTKRRCGEFLVHLSELVENRCPESVLALLNTEPDTAVTAEYDFDKQNVKIVLALREDFLANLEDLKGQLPHILQNRMRLLQMNGRQALEVVDKAGGHLLETGVAGRIVKFVAGTGISHNATTQTEEDLAHLAIEPALLSVVCRELNLLRIQANSPKISDELIKSSHTEILEGIFERGLAGLPDNVRKFMEDELLSVSGFRQMAALEDALQIEGITREVIETLVKRRLLRLEERFGVTNIELIHDLLTGVVKQSRDQRHQREALAREERSRQEIIARLHRTHRLNAVIAVLLLVTTIFYFLARNAKEDALTQKEAKGKALANLSTMYYNLKNEQFAKESAFRIISTSKQELAISLNNEKISLKQLNSALGGASKIIDSSLDILPRLYVLGEHELLSTVNKDIDDYFNKLAIKVPSGNFIGQKCVAKLYLGEVKNMEGLTKEAQKAFRDALKIADDMAHKNPHERKWQYYKALANRSIGTLLIQWGQHHNASKYYDRAEHILNRMLEQTPEDIRLNRELAIFYINKGDLLISDGKTNKALEYYKKANQIFLRESNSGEAADYSTMLLALSYKNIGDILAQQNRRDKAVENYKESLKIMEPLASRDAENTIFKWALFEINNSIADILTDEGKRSELFSEGYYQEVGQRWYDLAKKSPQNTHWRRNLVASYARFGDVLISEGILEKSEESYNLAKENLEKLLKSDPARTDWREDLSDVNIRIGDLFMANGKRKEAKALYRSSENNFKTLLEKNRDNHEWQRKLAESHERVGDVLKAEGQFSEARAKYQESIPLMEELVREEPKDLSYKRILSVGYTRIGETWLAEGNYDNAIKSFQKGELIRKEVAKDNPDNPAWLRDLVISRHKIGKALKARGDAINAEDNSTKVQGDIKRLAEWDIQNAGWLYDSRTALTRLEDFFLALELVLDRSPNDARLWNLKGLACKTLNKKKEGLEAYDRAIELARKDGARGNKLLAVCLLNRARNLIDQNEKKAAQADIKEALDVYPDIEVPKYLKSNLK